MARSCRAASAPVSRWQTAPPPRPTSAQNAHRLCRHPTCPIPLASRATPEVSTASTLRNGFWSVNTDSVCRLAFPAVSGTGPVIPEPSVPGLADGAESGHRHAVEPGRHHTHPPAPSSRPSPPADHTRTPRCGKKSCCISRQGTCPSSTRLPYSAAWPRPSPPRRARYGGSPMQVLTAPASFGHSDCERIVGAALAQPVLAITSLAYVAAGVAVLCLAMRLRAPLAGTAGVALVAVGAGSFAYHGPQPSWAEPAHDWPIIA